ncbi:MAG: RICIN domain-containing protein [Oscillospiraceae bacterium]|nr:RICIN domain-containing protein [Oscillospiraceae bacterium]
MANRKKMLAAVTAMTFLATAANSLCIPFSSNAAYGVGGNGTAIMEYLDRGIYAVKSGSGMFVSWRWNADDADDAEFRLYRDDTLIYTSKAGDPTCFQDNGGSAASGYRVDCIAGGKIVNSQACKFSSGSNYFDVKLNSPGSQYSPNDCCVGDVDGDGQYEIFLKWDPSNSKDNSQSGATDKVYIDCYTLEGKQLWRVDLGINIRAGQHYTQMCVADFDCDGRAELITKTADGTKDGRGKVIGDGSKDYRTGTGTILTGPEYLTLFDGQTGAALDTIEFPVPRGTATGDTAKKTWGDDYGNRCERMNSGIAYLDGVHPSAIYGRGYYTRLTWSAVDVKNGKLVKRWVYDTGFDKKTPGWGCGNHNVMVADGDNDGKQEIYTGGNCIDDNGKLLWTAGTLHGDAMHVGDLIPDHEGLEVWECHEDNPYGESCFDAKTGKTLFHINNTKDTGRCAADNVWAGSKGAEFWGAADGNVYNTSGKKIGGTRPAQNFFIYWDGDLEREILDGTKISKMTAADTVKAIFTAQGCGSNNSSKSVPCMTVDLFGDWREELILRTDDNKGLRIWCTTDTTKVRLTTLMHDMQYRAQNCCQQSSYNQPPHVSYYLGSDAPLPERPQILLNNQAPGSDIPAETLPATEPSESTEPVTEIPSKPTSEIQDGTLLQLRNAGSGLYLSLEGTAADNTNLVQGQKTSFKAVDAGDGWFYLIAQTGDGDTYAVDVHAKKTENGTNIELYTFNQGENQKFRFEKQADGSFTILTKISGGTSCIEIEAGTKDTGANVQEWEVNGGANQKWFVETASARTDSISGDVNSDGRFDTMDVILLQQWLLAVPGTELENWQAGDLFADGQLDIFDLSCMKKLLTSK